MYAEFVMTSNGDLWACDTSVAVAALDSTHEAHSACRRVLVRRRPALAGHALFETYSVLTRLPLPLRLNATQAASVLGKAFPAQCWLETNAAADLFERLAELGIVGGSVYDALVGHAASTNRRVLLTRDRRAERVYRSLDVQYEFVG
jgi:predicted nucleic acid-binding protein